MARPAQWFVCDELRRAWPRRCARIIVRLREIIGPATSARIGMNDGAVAFPRQKIFAVSKNRTGRSEGVRLKLDRTPHRRNGIGPRQDGDISVRIPREFGLRCLGAQTRRRRRRPGDQAQCSGETCQPMNAVNLHQERVAKLKSEINRRSCIDCSNRR